MRYDEMRRGRRRGPRVKRSVWRLESVSGRLWGRMERLGGCLRSEADDHDEYFEEAVIWAG